MTTTEEFLKEFVVEMKKVLDDHMIEKCESWMGLNEHELIDNLFQEIHEFEIKNDPQHELIDIANSCFLLWAKRKFLI